MHPALTEEEMKRVKWLESNITGSIGLPRYIIKKLRSGNLIVVTASMIEWIIIERHLKKKGYKSVWFDETTNGFYIIRFAKAN